MERDCVCAHGMAEFTKERLMECSDAFPCHICKDCGLIAIANPEQSIWLCRGCGNTTNFSKIQIPYASKLLLQEMESMCLSSRLITAQKLLRDKPKKLGMGCSEDDVDAFYEELDEPLDAIDEVDGDDDE